MNTNDVIARFNALDIGGFYAGDFTYRGREKLEFGLTDADRVLRTGGGTVISDYELHFSRILGGCVEAEGGGLGEISHWKAIPESQELSATLERWKHLTHGDSFVHFNLAGDQGKADVIARDFFLTVVRRSVLVRDGGGGG